MTLCRSNWCRRAGGRVVVTHPLHVARGRQAALRALKLQFWREIVPMLPMIAAGLRRADPDLRRRLKTALRLNQGKSVSFLDARFLPAPDAKVCSQLSAQPSSDQLSGQVVTIILPVFNAFALLPEVLARVAAHTDLPWHLIVVEDKSTDPEVRPWLRDWVRAQPEGRVTLLENEVNQGFIRSVNRGFDAVMQAGGTGPVILLNSDAMVPQGWASRLVAPLRSPDVASVTPLSNDAEIYSAPVICKNTQLGAGQGDRIDAILRHSIAGGAAPQVVAPTGVGFCMAIGSGWIGRVGIFDTQFGRGYGEEVDWCRRAAALGGLHVAATDLFVEHRGGASFGDEKLALIQQNNAVITTRYPGYDRSVQDFIRTDPLATPRLVAALAYVDGLAEVDEIPVYIAHSLGGGADNYLQAK